MININELAKEQEQYVINTRRYLHMHPELSCKEYDTTRFIISELESMGIEVVSYDDITGCMGIIKGNKPGKTIILRADIDALPIEEAPGKEFRSLNKGVMHACGHDAHTAMLLGAAKILNDHKDEINGTVRLLFQMGEEMGRYSEEYVKRGALDGADAIFGMHIWSSLEKGKANFEYGERMACSDRFTIHVHGLLSHGSAPHLGHDAILAASAAVMALQSIPSRQMNPLDTLVVTVGAMNGGTKQNILADDVELVGTVRTFDREFRQSMPERIEEAVNNAVAAYGCTADCTYYFGPSPLINDDKKLTEMAQGAARKILGEDCLTSLTKTTGAEDFSVYLEHIPGVYGYIGFRNEAGGYTTPHHHPLFDIDESVLHNGTAIYAQFAIDYLN